MLIKRKGFTLIEMLISLGVSALLLAALVGIFASNLSHYNKMINADRLNQQLQAALALMVNDIRRAGYSSNAYLDVGTGQNNNAFMSSAVDIQTPASNCILFSYDYNSDGSLPAVSNAYDDERYGFRLNGQVLQTRPYGSPFNCNANANSWENVTDPQIVNITNLTFTLNQKTVPPGATSSSLIIRSVNISITGQLTSDASVTKTFTQHVRIRNDKYVP